MSKDTILNNCNNSNKITADYLLEAIDNYIERCGEKPTSIILPYGTEIDESQFPYEMKTDDGKELNENNYEKPSISYIDSLVMVFNGIPVYSTKIPTDIIEPYFEVIFNEGLS